MTRADEPRRHGSADDDTDAYVIDTRRKRGRVDAPRNPLGGATRMTGRRSPSADEDARREPVEPRGERAWPGGPSYDPQAEHAPSDTRQVPARPARPTAPPQHRSPRPAPRPRPAGPAPASRPPRPRRRRRHPLRWLVLALLLWLAFLVVTPLHAWRAVSTVDAAPDGERPARVRGHNYLLVGSDSRAGLSTEEQQKLSTGDDAGQRTDSIMLVHVSQSGHPSALVSLPRDSWVPVPGHHRNKINAAYSLGGPELLVDTVEQATGVPIDGYVEIGFGGFAHVVDSLGGVSVDVPFDMDDPKAGINLKKGEQRLDGPQALGFVRSRYSDPEGDLGRAKRQRQFLGAIMHEAASPSTVLLPWRYWGFTHAAAGGVRLGDDTSLADVGRVLQALRSTSSGDGRSLVVPISNPAYPTPAGAAVKWDTDKAQELFHRIRDDEAL